MILVDFPEGVPYTRLIDIAVDEANKEEMLRMLDKQYDRTINFDNCNRVITWSTLFDGTAWEFAKFIGDAFMHMLCTGKRFGGCVTGYEYDELPLRPWYVARAIMRFPVIDDDAPNHMSPWVSSYDLTPMIERRRSLMGRDDNSK